jgi:hypothetical protein
MKKTLFTLLAISALCSAVRADDIVIFRRTLALSGTEVAETTAPNVTPLRPFTGRVTETQYEIIDLTNNAHVTVEVYAVDPLSGARGYLKNPVASGLGYSVMQGHPAGTQVWFNGRVFSEETAGVQTSTLLEIFEEVGRAAPTRVGTKTLVVPTRITIVSNGMDQYSNSEENLRASVVLAGRGTAVLDTRLSASLAADGDLDAAVLAVTTLLAGQGFVELDP